MPRYPSNYYGMSTNSTFNNNVTRRLAVRDQVAFDTSSRFGGQYIEQKDVLAPYNGTIIDTVAACQQLVNELNLISPVLPDMGRPVILSAVGVATNTLLTYNGIAVSYTGSAAVAHISGATGGVSTTIASTIVIDGVSIGTSLRILYYGLTTSALNGVYTVGYAQTTSGVGPSYFYLTRSSDLAYWWQFVKPKAYVVTQGTVNKGKVFSIQTDAFETGNSFSVASGATYATVTGTGISILETNYDPTTASGVGQTSIGLVGAGNTSVVYPAYTGGTTGVGEYDFLAQNSLAKFVYLKNRARRMAYQIFKMRENYTPFVSSYQNGVVVTIGTGNTDNNIGYSTLNNLPSGSRYPSSFNRGF